jgi:hypothetical protein
MKLRNAAVVVAVLGVLAAASAQPSFADSQIKAGDVGVSFQSWGEKFRIWDNECSDFLPPNGHEDAPVYILYKRWNASERRLDYDGGCHTMGLFDLNFAEGQIIDYKACLNKPLQRDWCSRSTRDRT